MCSGGVRRGGGEASGSRLNLKSRGVAGIPSSRSSLSIKESPWRLLGKKINNQPQKSVLESHLFIQQLFTHFTLIQCVVLNLRLREGTCWGGQGVYWSPLPLPSHWKEGSLSQPSVPDAFPPVLPSLNTRNDPFQHSKGRSVGVAGHMFYVQSRSCSATCDFVPGDDSRLFDPLVASLQGDISDSACVLSFILPLKR